MGFEVKAVESSSNANATIHVTEVQIEVAASAPLGENVLSASRVCSFRQGCTQRQPECSNGPGTVFRDLETPISGILPSSKTYGTPADVLCSRLVLLQIVFNMVMSAAFPILCFWFLFDYIGEGPYEWWEGACAGVVVGSCFSSPILVLSLAPLGMPEAVQQGWFFQVRKADCPPALLRWFPFLRSHPKWRNGTRRHLMLGAELALVYVPITMLLAGVAVGPTLETWTLIWFNVIFEVLLAPTVTCLGLLGFAMEENYKRVDKEMSNDPNKCKRLFSRLISCVKLLC